MSVKLTEAHGSVGSLSNGKDVRRNLIPPFATVKAWKNYFEKSTGYILNNSNTEIDKLKTKLTRSSNSPKIKRSPNLGDTLFHVTLYRQSSWCRWGTSCRGWQRYRRGRSRCRSASRRSAASGWTAQMRHWGKSGRTCPRSSHTWEDWPKSTSIKHQLCVSRTCIYVHLIDAFSVTFCACRLYLSN